MKLNTEVIKNFREKNKLTIRKFCQLCEISIYTYQKIMKNAGNVRVHKILKMLKILNISADEFLCYISPKNWKSLHPTLFKLSAKPERD